MSNNVWRKFDIRGLTSENITPNFAMDLGLGAAEYFRARSLKTVAVGRDVRDSSPALQKALMSGLVQGGMKVIDLGLAPTPTVYFATSGFGFDAGIIVTASHNPVGHNGFKFRLHERALFREDFQEIQANVQAPKPHSTQGSIEKFDIKDIYCQAIAEQNPLHSPLTIAIDAGNGSTSNWAPYLFEKMGAQIIQVNCEEDGTFPNHPADPTKTKNMLQLQQVVLETKADLGFAFDGDGDRVGMITKDGNMYWGDQLLAILMQEVLEWTKAPIVADVKCSMALEILAKQFGVPFFRSPTGYPLVQKTMMKENAILGGEQSSHICYRKGYYCFDDGLFTAAKLASIGKQLEQLIDQIPKTVQSPEIRQSILSEERERFDTLEAPAFDDCKLEQMDGLRYSNDDGWCLLRTSGTENKMIVRAEGIDQEAFSFWLGRLQQILSYFDIKIDLSASR